MSLDLTDSNGNWHDITVEVCRYSDTNLALWRHKSPKHDSLFNSFFGFTTKDLSKLRFTGPLLRDSTCDRWIPSTNTQ